MFGIFIPIDIQILPEKMTFGTSQSTPIKHRSPQEVLDVYRERRFWIPILNIFMFPCQFAPRISHDNSWQFLAILTFWIMVLMNQREVSGVQLPSLQNQRGLGAFCPLGQPGKSWSPSREAWWGCHCHGFKTVARRNSPLEWHAKCRFVIICCFFCTINLFLFFLFLFVRGCRRKLILNGL